jgi:hypothetical protein
VCVAFKRLFAGGEDRGAAGLDEEGDEGDELGEADRWCSSRSLSRSPRRMYLFCAGAGATDVEAEEASAAALRLAAISALSRSMAWRWVVAVVVGTVEEASRSRQGPRPLGQMWKSGGGGKFDLVRASEAPGELGSSRRSRVSRSRANLSVSRA